MKGKLFGLILLSLGLGGCYLSVGDALGPHVGRARAEKAPILIYAMGVPGEISVPGSVDTAVPVYVQFLVTDKRPIQQLRFSLLAYSRRGDPVRDHRGDQLQMILIGPGTFDPNKLYEVNSFNSRPAGFPGGIVDCVELRNLTVTYANGEKKTYSRPQLNIALMPQIRRGCIDKGFAVDSRYITSRD